MSGRFLNFLFQGSAANLKGRGKIIAEKRNIVKNEL